MGPTVQATNKTTWMIFAPDGGDDPMQSLTDCLAETRDAATAGLLVDSLLRHCVEAARRAEIEGGDVPAALLTGMLDAIGEAATGTPTPLPDGRHPMLEHLAGGIAALADAGPVAVREFVHHMIGCIEGINSQRRGTDTPALLFVTSVLSNLGGGPGVPFRFDRHGDELLREIAAAGNTLDDAAYADLHDVVDANAAFARAVEADLADEPDLAHREFETARQAFSRAGVPVEAAVCLRHMAALSVETDPDRALDEFVDARSVLAEFGRDLEVAQTDLHAGLLVAERVDVPTARGMINDARDVFVEHGLRLEAATCEALLANLAMVEGRRMLAASRFDTAAGIFEDEGDPFRSQACRNQARQCEDGKNDSP